MSTVSFDVVRAQAKLSSNNARLGAMMERFMERAGQTVAFGQKLSSKKELAESGHAEHIQRSFDHAEDRLDAKTNPSWLRHEQHHPASKK